MTSLTYSFVLLVSALEMADGEKRAMGSCVSFAAEKQVLFGRRWIGACQVCRQLTLIYVSEFLQAIDIIALYELGRGPETGMME